MGPDDGLTEIDLANNELAPLLVATTSKEHEFTEQDAQDKQLSPVPGFTALDTTDDDGSVSEIQSSKIRKSSLTRSELGEFVDVPKDLEAIETDIVSVVAPMVQEKLHRNSSTSASSRSLKRTHGSLEAVCKRLKSEKKRKRPRESRDEPRNDGEIEQWKLDLFSYFIYFTVGIFGLALICQLTTSGEDRPWTSSKDSFTKSVVTNRQLNELKLLLDELSQCIKRQSPTSFKYYMSENHYNDHHSTDQSPNRRESSSSKPYRGRVCYGQEQVWRKRFDRIKSEFGLDLKNLLQEFKRNLTNTILQSKHPALQFTLIIDQLEYLQFLEEKRNKKQTEETIKHLKAENLQLLRRLSQPNDNNYQKLVVSLELKNSRLQRQNEALKANLAEKAGTVYMRQSIELEQYERENVLLKQFYHQVALDVSKSLRQFNLHAMDAMRSLDDHATLNSQLMLTRGYLRKLGEKISSVLLENESLKEELREAYLTSVMAKGTNLQTAAGGHSDNYSAVGTNNDSNALIADGCVRNLMESRRRSKELEQEISRLQSECSRCDSFDLEKVSRDQRHLNTTGNQFYEYNSSEDFRDTKQLPDASSGTAMDKRYKDSLYFANEEIVDGLMTFLTKFNHQVESKNFLIMQSPDNDGQMMANGGIKSGLLTTERSFPAADDEKEMKIIPNYIREEVRSQTSRDKANNHNSFESKFDIGLPINFGADLLNATVGFVDTVSSYISNLSEQLTSDEQLPAKEAHAQPEVVESRPGVVGSEPVSEEPESKAASWMKRVVRDSWFFKRAKQRKHLRGQRSDRKGSQDGQANWAFKRAKLREKLREKLRKAWHYIEDTFAPASGKHKHKHNHNHHSHPHKPDASHQAWHGTRHHHKKTAHCMDYSNQGQRFKGDNPRDEL